MYISILLNRSILLYCGPFLDELTWLSYMENHFQERSASYCKHVCVALNERSENRQSPIPRKKRDVRERSLSEGEIWATLAIYTIQKAGKILYKYIKQRLRILGISREKAGRLASPSFHSTGLLLLTHPTDADAHLVEGELTASKQTNPLAG